MAEDDPRFKALKSDPRYRLPSKKEARTAVDPRFKTLFTDQEFRKKAAVDRYGRKIKPEADARDLERLYRLERDEEDDQDVDVEGEEERKVKKGKKSVKIAEVESDDSDESDEEEEEEGIATRDPKRDGFSSSESESEEESEDDEEDNLMSATAGMEQTEEIPMGEVSHRLAAVNLDWDNIRAADLLAVAASFAPAGGKVQNVTVYPSEFGKGRLEREELEGPPKEIFAASAKSKSTGKKEEDDEDESDEDEEEDYEEAKSRLLAANQATSDSEFDTTALRAYQLERLKYYYAVITCSSPSTAKALYDAMDGREYLSSANFFDLRFIPDEVSFEEDIPKDECSVLGGAYRPNEFRTEALTHSRVRLTWDDDDATRKEVQKRAFSRGEIEENDLLAYIGSDSESDASTKSTKSVAGRGKVGRKEAQRLKMRAALGLGEGNGAEKGGKKKKKDEELGDMQITFTSGLANAGGDAETAAKGKKGVFENEPQDEASTRERYIRKEKERKQARKERAKAARNAGGGEVQPAESDDEVAPAETGHEEDPFNDPFFADPVAATAAATSAARKAAKAEKRAKREGAEKEAEGRRAELELLMAGDGENDGVAEHFDMREIEKAEKEARRKGKGKGKKKEGKDEGKGVAQGDFEVDGEDERFGAVFDRHEFAIDPTNPRFKKTRGMVGLLEAGRKKRKQGGGEGEEEGKRGKKARKEEGGEESVQNLVARLKKR